MQQFENTSPPHPPTPQPTSAKIRQLLDPNIVGETLSVGEALTIMGREGLALLLLALALLNIILSPLPGNSLLLGIPMCIVAAHLCLGRQTLWLPQKIATRSLPLADLTRGLTWCATTTEKLEKLVHPRLPMLTSKPVLTTAYFLQLLLAILITLPIPFANIPPAIAIGLMALGELEDDGLMIAIGIATGLVAVGIVITLASLFATGFINLTT